MYLGCFYSSKRRVITAQIACSSNSTSTLVINSPESSLQEFGILNASFSSGFMHQVCCCFQSFFFYWGYYCNHMAAFYLLLSSKHISLEWSSAVKWPVIRCHNLQDLDTTISECLNSCLFSLNQLSPKTLDSSVQSWSNVKVPSRHAAHTDMPNIYCDLLVSS